MSEFKKYDPMRFWLKTKVTEVGCVLWTGAVAKTGYGAFGWHHPTDTSKKWTWTAHRWIWARIHGPIQPGLHVLHSCDVRLCVNPAHLRLGTDQDNVNDMMERRRHASFKQTHCSRGHEFKDGSFWMSRSGLRKCKACQAARSAKYYASIGGVANTPFNIKRRSNKLWRNDLRDNAAYWAKNRDRINAKRRAATQARRALKAKSSS